MSRQVRNSSDWNEVRALIASGNESPRRVAERLGMTYETETWLNGKGLNSYMRERN